MTSLADKGARGAAISLVCTLVPVVKAVLEEFVPDAEEATELVEGRVRLVDGTTTPCWSYADQPDPWSRKKGTTGLDAQLVSLLDGRPVFVSDPLPGKNHDAAGFKAAPVEEVVENSGGGTGDKGYQGYQGCAGTATPRKTPPGGELGKTGKKCNAELSALRAPVERVVAHVKSWRIFHTDYRRPYKTYRDAYDAARALFFFSINWGF
jgi:hypothetical protein